MPGCAKAPEAYRQAGLYDRLIARGAVDAGVVLPGRYVDDADPAAHRVRNQDAIIDHSERLAARIDRLLDDGHAPLALGGDCSLLIGAGLALSRRGRHGLVHLDGHTDFRHPGNNPSCASLAGEDLAAAVGIHWPAVANIDERGPYFDPADVVHIGCRDNDEDLTELQRTIAGVYPASAVRQHGPPFVAEEALDAIDSTRTAGYWLHLDVDVLDPALMPAVDSPDPDGLAVEDLVDLLTRLAPPALGAHVTIYDPELDLDGSYARLLPDVLTAGLADLGTQATGEATAAITFDR